MTTYLEEERLRAARDIANGMPTTRSRQDLIDLIGFLVSQYDELNDELVVSRAR